MRFLSLGILVALVSFAARADLASGTPQFACTLPTQQTDGTVIPSSGPNSLASIKWYLDSASTALKTIPVASGCAYNAAAGDIPPGAHQMRITAVNVAGGESAKTNPLAFTVPSPVPLAPSGLSVQ